MIPRDRTRRTPESPIGDVAYLARSPHRVPALVALTEGPRSRAELCELTDVSSSTVRRTLREFEARTWVRTDGGEYTATRLGEAVASGMEALLERVETVRELRDVWDTLPDEVGVFAFETGGTTTVTVAEYDAPYRPVNRVASLFSGADHVRFVGVDIGLYEPCNEAFRREVLDGMAAERIDSPSVARYMCETYPERCAELHERGSLTVLVHDDLPPYGLTLVDDRVAISGYDPDRGSVTAVVDTDAPAARAWAESVYAAYRADARPFDAAAVVG